MINNFKEPIKQVVKRPTLKQIIEKEKEKKKQTYLEIYATYLGLNLKKNEKKI